MVSAALPAGQERAPPTEAAIAAATAAYYAKRAAIYERIYHRPERAHELRAIAAWLGDWFAGRRVLELATGTGWWTPDAAARAADWLATDLSAETLAVARAKAMPRVVRYAVADIYALEDALFDGIDALFAGCWWSHVPLARLAPWWQGVAARLPTGARVAMLDNRFVPAHSTPLHRRDTDGNLYQWRTLDDGSVHEVVKNFPSAASAAAVLGPRMRHLQFVEFTHYWVLSGTLA